ncbi:MAG: hypothetical protein ABW118_10395 [Candidatus Thiodiazotropha sp.]
MLPSEYPQLTSYPTLKHVLGKQLDMMFVDIRCMLKAPFPECATGFNLSIASILLNIIAGFSRRLYRPSGSPNDSDRFKSMLIDYFPWVDPDLQPVKGANLLYYSLRNPLTHELGIKGKEKVVVSKNGKSTDKEIYELENNEHKPLWCSYPVAYVNLYNENFEWNVSVPGLYWATHRLLHNLLNDQSHISEADKRMKQIIKKINKNRN